jgi:5-methylcytosine-specific restriction endonuclease McrA
MTIVPEKKVRKRDRDLLSKLNRLHHDAYRRATKSGKSFNITNDDMLSLWVKQQGLCVYTKLPLQIEPNQLATVSLDRIDSSRGYEPDNVQLVCSVINVMKTSMSEREFVTMCSLVSRNNSLEEDL